MNRKTRFFIAAIITLILAVTATTVWAGSNNKQGSLGNEIHDTRGECNSAVANMGDATFTMTVAGKIICTFKVVRVKVPNPVMGGAPDGLEFRSDGFEVSGGPDDEIGTLEVCFAYSPQDEEQNAQIYAVFGPESGILPGVKEGTPTQLCAATPKLNGLFALVGNP